MRVARMRNDDEEADQTLYSLVSHVPVDSFKSKFLLIVVVS